MRQRVQAAVDRLSGSKYVFFSHLKNWSKKLFTEYLELLDFTTKVILIDKDNQIIRLEIDNCLIEARFLETQIMKSIEGRSWLDTEIHIIFDFIDLGRVS